MRFLVTGATGFLGGAIARRLVADGHRVRGTGRRLAQGAALTGCGVEFAAADLADSDAAAPLVHDVDCVIHCAGLASPWGRAADFEASNVTATAHLLDASEAADVRRFVHLSTPTVYANGQPRLGVRERDPLPARPANHYAASKRKADTLVAAAHARGLTSVWLRPRAIFGPGDATILPRLIRAMGRGGLPIIGSGDTLIDLTYIDNAVDGVLAAANAPDQVCGRAYNLSNGAPTALWPLAARIADELGLEPPSRRVPTGLATALAGALEMVHSVLPGRPEPRLTRHAVSVMAHSLTLDISDARSALGYAPAVSIDDGLARFLSHWSAAQTGP